MSILQNVKNIESFFESTSSFADGLTSVFRYVAIRIDSAFVILKAHLILNLVRSDPPLGEFNSANIRAGEYSLSDLHLTARQLVEELLTGSLQIPGDKLLFAANSAGTYGTQFLPFHPEGLKSQRRVVSLKLFANALEPYLRQPEIDWELMGCQTPFEGLHELLAHYRLGPLRTPVIEFEGLNLNVIEIDHQSSVAGEIAEPAVLMANSLDQDQVTLGYRIFSKGQVVQRGLLRGSDMTWTDRDDARRGSKAIDVPKAAIVHVFANYAGVLQHHYWLADPTTSQNPRRMIFGVYDDKLTVLRDFLERQPGKRAAHDFELGVAWLFWLLGFSVANIGGTPKLQDAPDLFAATPEGHFAVVECTTGLLKSDHKLPLVVSRTTQVRKELDRTGNGHLRVLPVLVTSKLRAEVEAELAHAHQHGVYVVTREALYAAIERTLLTPDPNQLYRQAEQAVLEAKS